MYRRRPLQDVPRGASSPKKCRPRPKDELYEAHTDLGFPAELIERVRAAVKDQRSPGPIIVDEAFCQIVQGSNCDEVWAAAEYSSHTVHRSVDPVTGDRVLRDCPRAANGINPRNVEDPPSAHVHHCTGASHGSVTSFGFETSGQIIADLYPAVALEKQYCAWIPRKLQPTGRSRGSNFVFLSAPEAMREHFAVSVRKLAGAEISQLVSKGTLSDQKCQEVIEVELAVYDLSESLTPKQLQRVLEHALRHGRESHVRRYCCWPCKYGANCTRTDCWNRHDHKPQRYSFARQSLFPLQITSMGLGLKIGSRRPAVICRFIAVKHNEVYVPEEESVEFFSDCIEASRKSDLNTHNDKDMQILTQLTNGIVFPKTYWMRKDPYPITLEHAQHIYYDESCRQIAVEERMFCESDETVTLTYERRRVYDKARLAVETLTDYFNAQAVKFLREKSPEAPLIYEDCVGIKSCGEQFHKELKGSVEGLYREPIYKYNTAFRMTPRIARDHSTVRLVGKASDIPELSLATYAKFSTPIRESMSLYNVTQLSFAVRGEAVLLPPREDTFAEGLNALTLGVRDRLMPLVASWTDTIALCPGVIYDGMLLVLDHRATVRPPPSAHPPSNLKEIPAAEALATAQMWREAADRDATTQSSILVIADQAKLQELLLVTSTEELKGAEARYLQLRWRFVEQKTATEVVIVPEISVNLDWRYWADRLKKVPQPAGNSSTTAAAVAEQIENNTVKRLQISFKVLEAVRLSHEKGLLLPGEVELANKTFLAACEEASSACYRPELTKESYRKVLSMSHVAKENETTPLWNIVALRNRLLREVLSFILLGFESNIICATERSPSLWCFLAELFGSHENEFSKTELKWETCAKRAHVESGPPTERFYQVLLDHHLSKSSGSSRSKLDIEEDIFPEEQISFEDACENAGETLRHAYVSHALGDETEIALNVELSRSDAITRAERTEDGKGRFKPLATLYRYEGKTVYAAWDVIELEHIALKVGDKPQEAEKKICEFQRHEMPTEVSTTSTTPVLSPDIHAIVRYVAVGENYIATTLADCDAFDFFSTTVKLSFLEADGWAAFVIRRCLQALLALKSSLENPILHRDIKPANILLSIAGDNPKKIREANLGDLGIARERKSDSTRTATGNLQGTDRYLAASVERGDGRYYYGEDCEVWALALTALDLLMLSHVGPGRYKDPLVGFPTEWVKDMDHRDSATSEQASARFLDRLESLKERRVITSSACAFIKKGLSPNRDSRNFSELCDCKWLDAAEL